MVLLGGFGARAHRPSALALAGLLVGAAGAVLLIDPWSHSAHGSFWPELVLIVGCLGWAINSVYQRSMHARLPVASLIGWQMLLGGTLLGLVGLACRRARALALAVAQPAAAVLPGDRRFVPRPYVLCLAGAAHHADQPRHLRLRESADRHGAGLAGAARSR